jgi:hypothetical protein
MSDFTILDPEKGHAEGHLLADLNPFQKSEQRK